MSNDIQKADQIAHRFYTKLVLVVNDARSTELRPQPPRVDKWFNLETPDSEQFRERLRIYRSISQSAAPPIFELQVLLCVPELNNNQVLVYIAPDSSRIRVEPTPRQVLLESWTLSFASHPAEDRGDVAPPTMYKHGIPLFRSLYTLLRILPAWKQYQRLRRRTGGPNRIGNLQIRLEVRNAADDDSDDSDGPEGILGFGTPLSATRPALGTDSHTFPSIPHPMGTLTLSVAYLLSPNFQLDELESLLSSRFLEGPEFTPTLVKNQQRDSLSGGAGGGASGSSPVGSLPIRTSLPPSPPSAVAERFVLPAAIHTRTTSFPGVSGGGNNGGGNVRNAPSPFVRPGSGVGGPAGSASGVSVASSSRVTSASGGSKDEGHAMSSLARMRRESTGMSRGADLPSAPSPLPIRRPTVSPFKSSALSSSPSLHSPSPSLRGNSPLSTGAGGSGTSGTTTGPSLPSRPPILNTTTSPSTSRNPIPPSPIGIGSGSNRLPSSPIAPLRPSPPFAPSSLGGRSLASAEGSTGAGSESSPGRMGLPTGAKRYSSSFGHRYAASAGGGSEGSPGSGNGDKVGESRKEGGGSERPNPSFLGGNPDDDDISAFVQDIDARRPLSGHHFQYGGPLGVQGQGHDREPLSSGTSAESSGKGKGKEVVPEERGGHRRYSSALHPATSNTGATPNPASRGSPSPGVGTGTGATAVLTSQSAVGERLREMHDTFMASLEGLGGRRRERTRSEQGSREGSLRSGRSESPALNYAARMGGGDFGGRSGDNSDAGVGGAGGYGRGILPPRPRYGSGASGFSIASAEVIGKLELDDGQKTKR